MDGISPRQSEPAPVQNLGTRKDVENRGNEGSNRQRARVACTRCRRLRKRCIHPNPQEPCLGCQDSGSTASAECRFPARGEPDFDRSYRRQKAATSRQVDEIVRPPYVAHSEKNSPPSSSDSRISANASSSGSFVHQASVRATDRWVLLPPYNEVVEACKIFGTSFFQLGFLPKAIFLEQLANHRSTINVFFLLAVLSVSARFTPSLIARYGDGPKAAEIFMERAAKLVPEEMYTPTLERIQAFFLLAIAEWGKGEKTSSNIHMGIAVRMTGILRLHREETYALAENSTAEDVINNEMARRTFWMLESQDNLHSGYTTPVSFSLGDITTLLPCEEKDFSFGLVPQERAALAGTLAAVRHSNLVHMPSRSLFATLIQAHNLWGQVARGAVTSGERYEGDVVDPWNPESDYARLSTALKIWEDHLPARHKWSIWNFRGYKAEGLDLAYLAIVMVLRLSNIILRRSFIENIIHKEDDPTAPENFWKTMSVELFENVLALSEQIDAFFSLRSPEQGFPAMIVFCVYVCGSLANHLWKRPEICPNLSPGMNDILRKSLKILSDLQHPWQLARKWKTALEQRALVAEPERIPNVVIDPEMREGQLTSTVGRNLVNFGGGFSQAASNGSHAEQLLDSTIRGTGLHERPTLQDSDWNQQGSSFSAGGFNTFPSPGEDIEAQLIAFLGVQGQLGMLYDQSDQL